jgi:hypothetical protein
VACQALLPDLDAIVSQFDALSLVRCQPPDLVLAPSFLLELFRLNQPMTFIAQKTDGAVEVGSTPAPLFAWPVV